MGQLRNAIRDLTMATKALTVISLLVTLLAFGAACWLWTYFPLPDEVTVRVQYLERYIGIAQVIGVGVVVTLVSMIIPLTLPEARDRFERYKESRQAYSRTKTAVLYLPDRVANVDQEKAFLLIEEAHREIHFAETFEDVIIEKGHLNWFGNPELWTLYNYWQIVAVAEVLRSSRIDWSDPKNKNMLRQRLRETLKVVHLRFGTRGENCKGEKWDFKEGPYSPRMKSRFKEENDLEERIRETASKPTGEKEVVSL